jgi:hypothetical protein
MHYLKTKLYTDYLKKKLQRLGLWAYRAFAGTSFMTLRIPVVSVDFSSFLIFAIKDLTCFGR